MTDQQKASAILIGLFVVFGIIVNFGGFVTMICDFVRILFWPIFWAAVILGGIAAIKKAIS